MGWFVAMRILPGSVGAVPAMMPATCVPCPNGSASAAAGSSVILPSAVSRPVKSRCRWATAGSVTVPPAKWGWVWSMPESRTAQTMPSPEVP